MAASYLRRALLGLLLILGGIATTAAEPARPKLGSLVITLEDGRRYSLTARELEDPEGGAIFWGDWAVTNLLVPFYAFSDTDASPFTVIQLWWTPGSSWELPAFLVNTASGPRYPLDPGGPQSYAKPFQSAHRPRVDQIVVGYKDGRTFSLAENVLRDSKSGVLLWNDFSIENMLVPFYAYARKLPTSPADALKTWNTPVPATSPSGARTLAAEEELPGFLVKPRCIPAFPGE